VTDTESLPDAMEWLAAHRGLVRWLTGDDGLPAVRVAVPLGVDYAVVVVLPVGDDVEVTLVDAVRQLHEELLVRARRAGLALV
jgi:hypothetical protein